jgi:hypothetical protein
MAVYFDGFNSNMFENKGFGVVFGLEISRVERSVKKQEESLDGGFQDMIYVVSQARSSRTPLPKSRLLTSKDLQTDATPPTQSSRVPKLTRRSWDYITLNAVRRPQICS